LTSCIHHRTGGRRSANAMPAPQLYRCKLCHTWHTKRGLVLVLEPNGVLITFSERPTFFLLRRRPVREMTFSATFFSHTVFLTLSCHTTGPLPFAVLGPQLPLVCSWELRGRGGGPAIWNSVCLGLERSCRPGAAHQLSGMPDPPAGASDSPRDIGTCTRPEL
jgi:hypothetical protein